MRGLLATLTFGLAVAVFPVLATAAPPAFEIQVFDTAALAVTANTVANGVLDAEFKPYQYSETKRRSSPFWLRIQSADDYRPSSGVSVLIIHKGRHLGLQLFTKRAGAIIQLAVATELPQFRAAHDVVFLLPDGLSAGQSFYARVEPRDTGSQEINFSSSTLNQTLALGSEHERMIALSFGALMAMALAVLFVWFVLSDKLFIHYALLISLQAMYVVYFTGQGFAWPVLSYALPLTSYAWNVPAALSGAVASLFVREIADLRHFSPRVYRIFGWLAGVYVALAFANLADFIGLGVVVAAIGNLVFLSSAIFTLVVAFLAWRRGSNAAGWFLIAWTLLEIFTIATAVSLLVANTKDSNLLLYYGLPLSMVAAAILLALGVADRLRDQRRALTEAERRAQTDSLTGVLNRRSLIERLDAVCLRAQARSLPISLLFIDLDHFKEINDTYGHLAGDACLRAIIAPIQTELRQSDVIGRYGGEEFVVILSSADAAAAHPIAERILQRVADVQVEGFGKPIRLTCSIGVATSDTLGVWGEHLIAHADIAVYAAKKSGRNRVRLAGPLAA